MIAAVFFVLVGFMLWMLFFIIQFTVLLSLLALALGLVVTVAVYGASFFGFYYLFGEGNTGWAIFAAMFLGSVILSIIAKSMKQLLSQDQAVLRDHANHTKNNGRIEKIKSMVHEKDHPIYSKYPDIDVRGSVLIVEHHGKWPKYYYFSCQTCGFKFTRVIHFGIFCPSCASRKVENDRKIKT